MRSRYEAYIDGIALSTIHPGILLTNVEHHLANYNLQTQAVANRNGLMILNRKQGATSVSISFELRVYKTQERQVALQKIQQWAQGKTLETSDREGQKLNIICTAFPAVSSVQDWNDTLKVGFTAYDQPFWENKTPSVITLVGDDEDGVLFVPGNAGEAYAEVEVTPSQTIDDLTVTVGDTSITLDDLNTNAVIKIGYDEKGIQYIKAGTTSILSKRTANSSDDLIAICGKKNAVAVEADHSVTAKFSVRGLWL